MSITTTPQNTCPIYDYHFSNTDLPNDSDYIKEVVKFMLAPDVFRDGIDPSRIEKIDFNLSSLDKQEAELLAAAQTDHNEEHENTIELTFARLRQSIIAKEIIKGSGCSHCTRLGSCVLQATLGIYVDSNRELQEQVNQVWASKKQRDAIKEQEDHRLSLEELRKADSSGFTTAFIEKLESTDQSVKLIPIEKCFNTICSTVEAVQHASFTQGNSLSFKFEPKSLPDNIMEVSIEDSRYYIVNLLPMSDNNQNPARSGEGGLNETGNKLASFMKALNGVLKGGTKLPDTLADYGVEKLKLNGKSINCKKLKLKHGDLSRTVVYVINAPELTTAGNQSPHLVIVATMGANNLRQHDSIHRDLKE